MNNQNHKKQLEKEVALGVRNFGISSTLFRHAVGDLIGVNVTDMECLGVLFFKGISTPSELSRYTGLSSGATTAMLDRLEKSGLIRRQPNPNDRRGTYIEIVKEAAKRVDPLFASARAAQGRLITDYSEKELVLLADFFNHFADIWKQERDKLKNLPASQTGKRKVRQTKGARGKGG